MSVHFVAALAAFFASFYTFNLPRGGFTHPRVHPKFCLDVLFVFTDLLLESIHPLTRRPPQQRSSARKVER
ncbi:unnamed protein product [Coregonus sp. 'balchen']|nr:unnamed protein product [Coregonus sp. 'balchen']